MVDNFSILLTHGLMLTALWLLLSRDDLDVSPPRKLPVEPVAEPEAATSGKRKPSNRWRAD